MTEPDVVDDLAEAATAPDPGVETPAGTGGGGVRGWIGWLVRRPAAFGGLAGALIFFWLSLTPSLLPRPWFGQAFASGVSAAFGYGIGSGLSALIRTVLPREPSPAVKRQVWRALIGVAVIGTVIALILEKGWQNGLRGLMGIEEEPDISLVALLVATLFVASLSLLIARLVRSLTRFVIRQVNRLLPRPAAVALGVALAMFIIVGVLQGFLWRGAISAMNSVSGSVNGTTSDTAFEPTSDKRSGGPGSLVSWDSLGRQGRDFTGRGPTVADLEKFDADGATDGAGGAGAGAGTCCEQPIRVYVGLDSAPSAHERAELAVKELDRTGAFDRKVLAVFGATGTGWINPRVASSLEYLHGGDTAEVSIQYSFLPSWLSFLVDQNVASEAGRELFGAVRARLDQIPEAKRPKLLLFGESLGSYATEAAFTDISDLQAHSDGALLVGPTFSNDIWTELTETRIAGSPQWRPKVRQPAVRFAGTPADLEGFRDVAGSRVVYLQNSSDPITWFSSDLAYRKPDWAGDPAAPDRSPAFTWMPLVTFWQVVADLADSLGVPTGFGHHFGSNVVDGWVAISAPDDWTPADTARLKAVVGERG